MIRRDGTGERVGMRQNHSAALAVLAVVAIGVVVPVAASSAKPAGKTVVLKNISFNPSKVTVKKGATVTWSWQDAPTAHTLTPTGKLRFKGTAARTSGKYSVTFTKAGTYHYECTIHPGMTGEVIVK
jgi:plastocyanin